MKYNEALELFGLPNNFTLEQLKLKYDEMMKEHNLGQEEKINRAYSLLEFNAKKEKLKIKLENTLNNLNNHKDLIINKYFINENTIIVNSLNQLDTISNEKEFVELLNNMKKTLVKNNVEYFEYLSLNMNIQNTPNVKIIIQQYLNKILTVESVLEVHDLFFKMQNQIKTSIKNSKEERLFIINSNLNAIVLKYKTDPCYCYIKNQVNELLKIAIESTVDNLNGENNYELYYNFEKNIIHLLNQTKEKLNKISYLFNRVSKIPTLKTKVIYIGKVKKLEKNLNVSNFDKKYSELVREVEYAIKQNYIDLLKETLGIKFQDYFMELDLVKDNKKISQALKIFNYVIKICDDNPEKIEELLKITFSDYDHDIQVISTILNEQQKEMPTSNEMEPTVQETIPTIKTEQPSDLTKDEEESTNDCKLFVRTDKFTSSNNIVKLVEDDGENVRIAYRCNSAVVEDVISKEMFKKRYVPFRNYFDSAQFIGKMTGDNRLLLYAGGVLGLQYIKEYNKFMALPKAYIEKCVGEEVVKDDRELYYKLITEYFAQSIDENKVNYSYDDSENQKKH